MIALVLAVALAQPPAGSVAPARADSAPRRAADRWIGEDKLRHFALAGLVQGATFGAATAAGARGRPALVTASAVTAAVSVGKEWHDRRRGGRFSGRDLVWDAAGAVLWGALVARAGR